MRRRNGVLHQQQNLEACATHKSLHFSGMFTEGEVDELRDLSNSELKLEDAHYKSYVPVSVMSVIETRT